MARSALAVQTMDSTGLTPSFTAADAAGSTFEPKIGRFLRVKNASGSPINVTLTTPGSVDGLAIPDRVVAVPATTGDVLIGLGSRRRLPPARRHGVHRLLGGHLGDGRGDPGAVTQPAPPSSEATQAAQVAMAALVAVAIAKLWPSFLLNPASALPAFKAAVVREVRSGAQASGALAQRQYRRQRAAAGETSTFRTSLATLAGASRTSRPWSRRRWPASASTTRRPRRSPTPRRGWPRRPRMSCSTPASARSWRTPAGTEQRAVSPASPSRTPAGSAACWPPVAPSTRTAASRAATPPSSPMERSPPRSRSTTTAGATPSPCSASTRRPRGSARQRPPTSPPASDRRWPQGGPGALPPQMVEGRYQPTES
jgi:hypothetical protein